MTRLYSILLRLALARVMEARLEEPPVVFLDDPESELDERWIGPVLGLVPERSQVIVTACRPLTAIRSGSGGSRSRSWAARRRREVRS
jgi:recombinational DNA repair ATPase RecF